MRISHTMRVGWWTACWILGICGHTVNAIAVGSELTLTPCSLLCHRISSTISTAYIVSYSEQISQSSVRILYRKSPHDSRYSLNVTVAYTHSVTFGAVVATSPHTTPEVQTCSVHHSASRTALMCLAGNTQLWYAIRWTGTVCFTGLCVDSTFGQTLSTTLPPPRQPTPRQPTPRQPTPRQPTPRLPTPSPPPPRQPTPRQPTPRQPTPRQPTSSPTTLPPTSTAASNAATRFESTQSPEVTTVRPAPQTDATSSAVPITVAIIDEKDPGTEETAGLALAVIIIVVVSLVFLAMFIAILRHRSNDPQRFLENVRIFSEIESRGGTLASLDLASLDLTGTHRRQTRTKSKTISSLYDSNPMKGRRLPDLPDMPIYEEPPVDPPRKLYSDPNASSPLRRVGPQALYSLASRSPDDALDDDALDDEAPEYLAPFSSKPHSPTPHSSTHPTRERFTPTPHSPTPPTRARFTPTPHSPTSCDPTPSTAVPSVPTDCMYDTSPEIRREDFYSAEPAASEIEVTSYTPDDDDSWDASTTVRLYDNPSDLMKAESIESLGASIDDEIDALWETAGVSRTDTVAPDLEESVLKESMPPFPEEENRDDIYGTSS